MRSAERVYLYTMALIALAGMLLGLINTVAGLVALALAGPVDGFSLEGFGRAGVLPWAALAVLGALIWVIHWTLANREARKLTIAGGAERRAPARKAYLWCAQFVSLALLVGELGLGLYYLFSALLSPTTAPLTSSLAQVMPALLGALLSAACWFVLRRVTVSDGDMGAEAGSGAGWRRAYYYLGTGLATLLAILGAGEFLRTFLVVAARVYVFSSGLAGIQDWRALVAAASAMTLVALPLAFLLWLRGNRVVATVGPEGALAEANALGRKLLLYAGMFAGTAVSLLSFGYLVWQLLLVGLGQPVANAANFWSESLVPALAYLPGGILLWLAFGNAARSDIDWAPESLDSAILRRLYYYLMSALGLAAVWYGLQALLVLAILLITSLWPLAVLTGPQARGYFSLATALFLAGGPAWWAHWRPAQELARQPGLAGYAERSSVLRRVYLYGVALAAAVVSVVTLGFVVAGAPGWLFGPTATTSFAVSMVQLGGGIAVALLWWITHGVVLRADERLRAEDESTGVVPAGDQLGNAGRAADAMTTQAGSYGEHALDSQFASAPPPALVSAEAVPSVAEPNPVAEAGAGSLAGQASQPTVFSVSDAQPDATPVAGVAPAGRQWQRGSSTAAGLAPAGAIYAAAAADSGAVESSASDSRSPAAVVNISSDGLLPAAAPAPVEPSPDAPVALTEPAPAPLRGRRFAIVAVIDGGDGELGAALLVELRRAYPDLVLWPVALGPSACEAMQRALGDQLPVRTGVESWARASLIVAPSDVLCPGAFDGAVTPELVAGIAASPAHRLLLPPRGDELRWVGLPDWPRYRWVADAVREVGVLLAAAAEE
jgi:hypothetical protein